MDSTIHINKYGVACVPSGILDILIRDKDGNNISVNYNNNTSVLKFAVNKFTAGDTAWTTAFFDESLVTTTAYNTDNLQEGWYEISTNGTSWQDVYLCKYDRLAGSTQAANTLICNSNSISITPNVKGILTFHKVSNVEESFSTVIAYTMSNAQVTLNTSATYSPDYAYIFEKSNSTYKLYQALPFYPDSNGNYTFDSTTHIHDLTTGYLYDAKYWRGEQPIATLTITQTTTDFKMAGIDFAGVTNNELFIPAQRPSVGRKEFCILFNATATSTSISNALLAAYGQTSYLHGTFDVSFHGLDTASLRFHYGNGTLMYRSYIENFTL